MSTNPGLPTIPLYKFKALVSHSKYCTVLSRLRIKIFSGLELFSNFNLTYNSFCDERYFERLILNQCIPC
jgi:ABC-type transport system involved in cytochrome bd biosynthesis fused ATPase/permease subunit